MTTWPDHNSQTAIKGFKGAQMRIERFLAVVVLSIGLFGCAAPQPASQTAAAPMPAPASPPDQFTGVEGNTKPKAAFFPTEVQQALHEMQAAIIQACRSSQSHAELESCFRQHIATGFDTSGKGAQACSGVQEIGKFASCVSEGNLATDFYKLVPAGQMREMTDSDWLNPKPYVDRLDVVMSMHYSDLCLEANAADMQNCIRTQTEKSLNVTGANQQRCDALPVQKDFQQCIAEAFALDAIRRGTARMVRGG